MDHVIAPLDADHAAVVARLSAELAAALALVPDAAPRRPHITLSSYTALGPAAAVAAVAPVLARVEPLVVRAHGYGVFAGDNDNDLSLHVMVVRDRSLDELHPRSRRRCAAPVPAWRAAPGRASGAHT